MRRGRGGACLRLEGEGAVVELEPLQRLTETLVIVCICREEAAEDLRFGLGVAGQHVGGGAEAANRDRVADPGVLHGLDRARDAAHLARVQRVHLHAIRSPNPEVGDGVGACGVHECDGVALADDAVHHTELAHNAEVLVVEGVEDEGARGHGAIVRGRWNPFHHCRENVVDADAGLGGAQDGAGCIDAQDILDLFGDAVGVRGWQVDLVDDGDDLQVILHGEPDVSQRLCLDALARVDHEESTFTGC